MSTKYRAVKGTLPKKRDLVDWDYEKFLAYMQLVDALTENGKFNITGETRKAVELNDNPFWDEFLTRIDRPFGKADNSSFRMRLMTMNRTVGGYLKSNPWIITQEMRAIMDKNKIVNWVLDAFVDKETPLGAMVTVPNNIETTEPGRPNASPAQTNVSLPATQYQQALLNIVSMLKTLTESIKPNDLKKMQTEKKIQSINSLMTTVSKELSRASPSTMVFKQLNIHSASREELEKAFTEYNENQ